MWDGGDIVASFPVPTPLANAVGKAFGGLLLGLALGCALWTRPAQEELCLMSLWARPGRPRLSFTKCLLCAQQGRRRLGEDLVGFAGTWKILSLCLALSI